jgi:hypothetical protein
MCGNGWRSDFLHHLMCGVWDVEYSSGNFQDSHDGGAEADMRGHTLTHLLLHIIGPPNGSVERFQSRSHLIQQFCGEICPGLNARCTCFKAGLCRPQSPNPTLEYKREFRPS